MGAAQARAFLGVAQEGLLSTRAVAERVWVLPYRHECSELSEYQYPFHPTSGREAVKLQDNKAPTPGRPLPMLPQLFS